MNYDILVIGCGPAGIWATVYGILNNKKICVIEATKDIGGQPLLIYAEKTVEDIPGFIHIRAGEYVQNLIKQFEYYKDEYTLYLETRILNWIWDEKNMQYICMLSNNQTINARYIIFATGIGKYLPKKLTSLNQNNQLKEVNYIIKNLNKFQDKKIVIFGGGDSAIDWANFLIENKISNKISIVHRSNSFKALEKNVLKLEQNNIEQYLNYSLKDGNDYQLSLIHNENKDQEIIIEYDEIICMYGIEANNEHVEDLKVFDMKANKFITNRSQQTNIKNIYAIGQACIYENRANLIVVAQAEASNAIKAINNEDIKRKKELLKKDL